MSIVYLSNNPYVFAECKVSVPKDKVKEVSCLKNQVGGNCSGILSSKNGNIGGMDCRFSMIYLDTLLKDSDFVTGFLREISLICPDLAIEMHSYCLRNSTSEDIVISYGDIQYYNSKSFTIIPYKKCSLMELLTIFVSSKLDGWEKVVDFCYKCSNEKKIKDFILKETTLLSTVSDDFPYVVLHEEDNEPERFYYGLKNYFEKPWAALENRKNTFKYYKDGLKVLVKDAGFESLKDIL